MHPDVASFPDVAGVPVVAAVVDVSVFKKMQLEVILRTGIYARISIEPYCNSQTRLLTLRRDYEDRSAHCSPYWHSAHFAGTVQCSSSRQCALPSWLVLCVAILADTAHCSHCLHCALLSLLALRVALLAATRSSSSDWRCALLFWPALRTALLACTTLLLWLTLTVLIALPACTAHCSLAGTAHTVEHESDGIAIHVPRMYVLLR